MLTQKEKKIVDKLADAWSLFISLPEQHELDRIEFMHSIHQAQHLVSKRLAVREHPEMYTNKTLENKKDAEVKKD